MRSLRKASKLPIERIRYLPDSETSLIHDIKRGILFVMAFWSGPSVKAFNQLTEVVNRLDPDGTLEFVVIDTDGAQGFYEHPDCSLPTDGTRRTIAWTSAADHAETVVNVNRRRPVFESNEIRSGD